MTQEPYAPPAELKVAREHGTNRGILDGQRDALDRVESQAYLEAYHDQLGAAGLCRCEEIASAQASPAAAPVDLAALADQLSGFVVELSRIAAGLAPRLTPQGERMQPVHAPELVAEADQILSETVAEMPQARPQPELSEQVTAILTGLGERARARREKAGRQVDADETPATPPQQTLDVEPGRDGAAFVEVLQAPDSEQLLPRRQGGFLTGGLLEERARQAEAAAEAELAKPIDTPFLPRLAGGGIVQPAQARVTPCGCGPEHARDCPIGLGNY